MSLLGSRMSAGDEDVAREELHQAVRELGSLSAQDPYFQDKRTIGKHIDVQRKSLRVDAIHYRLIASDCKPICETCDLASPTTVAAIRDDLQRRMAAYDTFASEFKQRLNDIDKLEAIYDVVTTTSRVAEPGPAGGNNRPTECEKRTVQVSRYDPWCPHILLPEVLSNDETLQVATSATRTAFTSSPARNETPLVTPRAVSDTSPQSEELSATHDRAAVAHSRPDPSIGGNIDPSSYRPTDSTARVSAAAPQDNTHDISPTPTNNFFNNTSVPSVNQQHHLDGNPFATMPRGRFWKPDEGSSIRVPPATLPPNEDTITRVFLTEAERVDAAQHHMALVTHRATAISHSGPRAHLLPLPQVFRYGIQYGPDISSQESPRQGFQRGLTFFHLPPDDCPLRVVLSVVRGGLIVTAAKASTMAHVEFLMADQARKYYDFAKNNIKTLLGARVEVRLQATPTYPTDQDVLQDVERGFTRCILIKDFPPQAIADVFNVNLKSIYRRPEDSLEDVWMEEDRTLFLLFSSINSARRVFKAFIARPPTGATAADIFIGADPCAGPIERLGFKGAILARGPYKSILDQWVQGRSTDALPGAHGL
ncbi:hypothetical protein DL771_001483 [Monosporascus sp. 5C6A]|nr:hypothetical protein DL771_001483 [Monosporascus sp. 5C6A]